MGRIIHGGRTTDPCGLPPYLDGQPPPLNLIGNGWGSLLPPSDPLTPAESAPTVDSIPVASFNQDDMDVKEVFNGPRGGLLYPKPRPTTDPITRNENQPPTMEGSDPNQLPTWEFSPNCIRTSLIPLGEYSGVLSLNDRQSWTTADRE